MLSDEGAARDSTEAVRLKDIPQFNEGVLLGTVSIEINGNGERTAARK